MAVIPARMQQRRRTTAQWATENPVLAAAEIGVVTDTTPPDFKFGDGVTAWNSLPSFPELVAADPTELTVVTVGDTTTLTLTDLVARRYPSVVSGYYYLSSHDQAAAGTLAINVCEYLSVWLPGGKTMDRIGLEVTTGTGSSVIRCGVYLDNGGHPGNRIAEAAATGDGTTTGVKDLTITAAIPENGRYWLAAVAQGAATPVQSCIRGSMFMIPYGTTAPAGTGALRSVRQNSVTGALPATAGPFVDGVSGAIGPRVHFRFA